MLVFTWGKATWCWWGKSRRFTQFVNNSHVFGIVPRSYWQISSSMLQSLVLNMLISFTIQRCKHFSGFQQEIIIRFLFRGGWSRGNPIIPESFPNNSLTNPRVASWTSPSYACRNSLIFGPHRLLCFLYNPILYPWDRYIYLPTYHKINYR